MYTAPGFQVARVTYRLNYAGFTRGDHVFPVTFNLQFARNVATGLNERDAMLARQDTLIAEFEKAVPGEWD